MSDSVDVVKHSVYINSIAINGAELLMQMMSINQMI